MSILLMKYALNCADKSLGPIERVILWRLTDFSDETGRKVFPSISRLSRNIGASSSTTRKHLKNLIEKQYVSIVKRSNGNTKITNQYQLNIDKIKKNSEYRNSNNLEENLSKKDNIISFDTDTKTVDNFVNKSDIPVDNPVDNLCEKETGCRISALQGAVSRHQYNHS